MDTIVHAAIEEICSNGGNGITLALLWRRLHAPISAAGLTLCPEVKRAVISGLSAVPGIRVGTGSDSESVEVVAEEKLRECFVGLYDVKSSNITPPQQRVLERLALARGTGVTQNQLCKELGVPPNNFFYVVKRLESWGLIVRHSTIVRTKEAISDKEPKFSSQSLHATNLIRLQRYAPSLGSQQRFEITKESDILEESRECGQDDVRLKDFLPALKAICDRLEQAEGQVLVVADIKRELSYLGREGHRHWRRDFGRLVQAGLVEKFEAKVKSEDTPTTSKKKKSRGKGKPVSCLKLLKKFNLKLFEHRSNDCEIDNLASEKQVQNTDQLVELPLEQQIIDMIDAEGSKGLLGVEVCKRLGINNRTLDNLSNAIVPRFGLHRFSESHKRGTAFRFWTNSNFHSEHPNSSFIGSEHGPDEVREASSPAENPFRSKTLSCSERWLTNKDPEKGVTGEELEHGSQKFNTANGAENVARNMSSPSAHASDVTQSNSLVVVPTSPAAKLSNVHEGRRYPSVTSVTREQRLLEILESEKIIVKPELQYWLETTGKDKRVAMDRKTLSRLLAKLQHEGRCRVMEFHIPGVSNGGRHREIRVVLHPSIKGSASELSEQVHEKMRLFEMKNRSALSSRRKETQAPILHGIERIPMDSISDAHVKFEAIRSNGFISGKMVRAKLLHCFLWDYANNLSRCSDASSYPQDSCLLFSLDTAMKTMPIKLFLQVVGSPLKWKDMTEKCKKGVLLSGFSDEEYKSLMDTQATSRLSRLTHILHHLKLIRLLADGSRKDAVEKTQTHTTLVYALNLKPYIEEPPTVYPHQLAGCSTSVDLRPHFRHDFLLSTTEAVESYWQTLENCYATAHPKAAVLAFPGSVAYKVLRVYYYNRHKKLQEDSDVRSVGSNARNDARNSRRRFQRKRKRQLEESSASAKHVLNNYPDESLEVEDDEQEQQDPSTEPCIMPVLKQSRQLKFSWTVEADRQLITQYARQKAIRGARSGTDWASISDLPAAPRTCRRRLAYLHMNDKFRKSLMKLCNLLSQRYAQYLENKRVLKLEELGSSGECWDDFENTMVKAAFDEVLMMKKTTKTDPPKSTGSASQDVHEPAAGTPSESENDGEKQQISPALTRRVHRSLAVSSAVELFKLYFLTNSNSADMLEVLQAILRRYSQHDLYSAFDYLSQRKILIGSDSSLFLSQRFLSSLSSSQFPINTGKRADKLATWIQENEKNLMEDTVDLPLDLQCGDIYQLMALVSCGELSISPGLPHEGVGEAEDSRSLKRKYDDDEYDDLDTSKKQKGNPLPDSEISSRREKGFPGIAVSLSRTTMSRSNVVELFKDESSVNHLKESPDFDSLTPSTVIHGDSNWEVMANVATQNLSNHLGREIILVNPELIKSTYGSVQEAGDQGLSMSEISDRIGIPGTTVSEHVVDVLKLFGLVVKVNGYNTVRVVDVLYRAKYFLTSEPTSSRDPKTKTTLPTTTNMTEEGVTVTDEHEDVHKVTILNLPKDGRDLSNAVHAETSKNQNSYLASTTAFHPILPWINRDGTVNGVVYRALTRRILGIVTQNPGILEDGILTEMNVLNPQCCRKLLELMVLDKHVFQRKMTQRTSPATSPALLDSLTGNRSKKPKYVCREHYFVNPMTATLLL